MKIIEILEEFRKIFANERDKGTAFEKIVKIYLENEPKYREIIEKVWMWTDFPYRDNMRLHRAEASRSFPRKRTLQKRCPAPFPLRKKKW